MRVPG